MKISRLKLILRRHCLQRKIVEEKMRLTKTGGRRKNSMLEDPENGRNCRLKKEVALD